MKHALIIFVRHPEPGKVKTRLAAALGNDVALSVYKKLLAHTLSITTPLNADKFVFYTEAIVDDDLWHQPNYFKHRQSDGDLGDRMLSAFEYVFANGYNNACIIGSDCYDLSTTILQEAFDLLTHNDVVVGPATDGGYYLLGSRQVHPSFFKNKNWSTATVLQEAIAECEHLGLSVSSLPVLSDVDEASDVPVELLKV